MSDETPEGHYRCALCKGVFEKGWSDEEAKAEYGQVFPGKPLEEADVVCDDCYKRIGLG